jgi:hypothetical protein
MTDIFLAIALYFAGLSGLGHIPADPPLAPPGPEGPPALRVSVCERPW